jgi:glycosyltransferase involved in cell wall biosynthesis
MVLLEAWSLNKPVLVNGYCEVLVGQCRRSNGGLWYRDYDEFVACIEYLLENKGLAKNAYNFVKQNYAWNVVMDKYIQIISLDIR